MRTISFENLRNSLQGQVIAHRGAPHLAPENTLSSFKMAAKLKAKWVEFDTQPCASGEWVVFHDETLSRTTNGQGKIFELPYAYLKTLDAGSWMAAQFKDEPIPLLSEVLTLFRTLGLHPNIEIKLPAKHDRLQKTEAKAKILDDFCAILANHWPKDALPPLISSFDFEVLALLKNKQQNYPLALNIEKVEADLGILLKSLEVFSLHCNYESLPTETLRWLLYHVLHPHSHPDPHPKQHPNSLDFSLSLYTVNEKTLAKSYIDAGVTAIFSDIPNLFL